MNDETKICKCGSAMENSYATDDDRKYLSGRHCEACGYSEGDV